VALPPIGLLVLCVLWWPAILVTLVMPHIVVVLLYIMGFVPSLIVSVFHHVIVRRWRKRVTLPLTMGVSALGAGTWITVYSGRPWPAGMMTGVMPVLMAVAALAVVPMALSGRPRRPFHPIPNRSA
jgi:hypothetical protein